MKKEQPTTDKVLTSLLSGKHPLAEKYAGKHVLVVNNKVVPLKEGEAGFEDFLKLKEKYGQPPTLVFIPRPDISYILILK